MVGVLMAFYLTEYGKKISRSQSEKEILSQIYFELKNSLNDLQNDLAIHEVGLSSNLNVIKFLDNEAVDSDSLIMDFYWMTRDEYIFSNSSGYENLKSFGINLIQDDTLRTLISVVYNINFPRLVKGNTLNPDISDYLTPFFQKNFKTNRDTSLKYSLKLNDSFSINYPREMPRGITQLIGYIPIDEKELMNNEEFRFLVSKSLEFRMYKCRIYNQCIRNVRSTLERIEKMESS